MRLIMCILAFALLAGCDGSNDRARGIQPFLESAVASGATSFDFAAGPAFAWDRMYVFDCYSSRASVEKALGFAWPDFSKTTIESSDSVVLVVFVQNAKVVGWYEQPRTIELGHLANDKGYARSEAVFEVDRSTGRVELKPQTAVRAPATSPTVGSRGAWRGVAENHKVGAFLSGPGIYVDLPDTYWPSKIVGTPVDVTGMVVERHDLPVFVDDQKHPARSGIPVPPGTDLHEASKRLILEQVKWHPIRDVR